jgi:MFS transporter, ACS family, tartrate transporter
MIETVERSAIRKLYMRLLPIALLTYFLCYIDRINVGFAALTMRGDLGMSATAFGFAAGSFYWGYFIFEVPSNIIMEKVGARLWIARIMITWGLLSCATAWVTGPQSFTIIRFLLGVAEAGFFPGLVLYFTYWFPSQYHARIVSAFLVGLPIAIVAGAPLSTAFLSLDGVFGLHGWQLMFLLEAIPTVLVGVIVMFVLPDRPERAEFLTDEERVWLIATLARERRSKEAIKLFNISQAMLDPQVLLLALNYLGIVTASLGMLIFIPQIIKTISGASNMSVGWLTMIPYICATLTLLIWGHVSDRMNERRWNLFWTCAISTLGMVLAGVTMGTWWTLVGLTIAACGFYGSKGPFWAMPPMFLSGPGAAAAIAWINSIGNLGGFFGPWYVGAVKDATGSYAGGLYGLALFSFIATMICAVSLNVPNNATPSALTEGSQAD